MHSAFHKNRWSDSDLAEVSRLTTAFVELRDALRMDRSYLIDEAVRWRRFSSEDDLEAASADSAESQIRLHIAEFERLHDEARRRRLLPFLSAKLTEECARIVAEIRAGIVARCAGNRTLAAAARLMVSGL